MYYAFNMPFISFIIEMFCGDPGDINHATKTGSNYYHGGNVTYTCDIGYNITSGDETRTCNGTWTGSQPVCSSM